MGVLGTVCHDVRVPAVNALLSVGNTCSTTKAVRTQAKQPAERATEKLHRIHVDYWGPYKRSTIGGNRYIALRVRRVCVTAASVIAECLV